MRRSYSVGFREAAKYTLGSYIDLVTSAAARVAERLLPEEQWDATTERSPAYQLRERLRESLDTAVGNKFILATLPATGIFYLVGMPAAEVIADAIQTYMPNVPELGKLALDSVGTVVAQTVIWYTAFVAGDYVVNHETYRKEGRIKKLYETTRDSLRALLPWDVSYASAKLLGQTGLLLTGRNPWAASAIFDTLTLPFLYVLMVWLSMRKGLVISKPMRELTP